MGQHKYNEKAKLAKEGKLPPKEEKRSLKDLFGMRLLSSFGGEEYRRARHIDRITKQKTRGR